MTANRSRVPFLLASVSAILSLIGGVTLAAEKDSSTSSGHKIVATYFEEWSIYGANYNVADIQNSGAANVMTELLYAFANVSPTGQCAIADTWADYQDPYLPSVTGQPYTGPLYGNFAALLQLKQLHPNLKVLISIGGASAANSTDFSAAASTRAGRLQLATSCVNMFINGNVAAGISAAGLFDGIDLDWEFPGPGDTENFTSLVAEFHRQLEAAGEANKKTYLLTMAAPAGSQNYSNIQLAAVARDLNYMNLETYDYHGTWETITNHEAPLFESPYDPSLGQGLTVSATVQAYLNAGVPARKLVLGIPAYGRGWTGVPNKNWGLYQTSSGAAPSPPGDTLATPGVATYRTLETFTASGFTLHHDSYSFADWLYNPATQTFWTFDDPETVQAKMQYAKYGAGNLAGAFEWAIKDDDAKATLLRTMAETLNGTE